MSSVAALSPRRATYFSFASPKESRQRKGDLQSGEFLGLDVEFAESMARPAGAVRVHRSKIGA